MRNKLEIGIAVSGLGALLLCWMPIVSSWGLAFPYRPGIRREIPVERVMSALLGLICLALVIAKWVSAKQVPRR